MSKPMENRIDFVAIITCNGANPNGDPNSEGIPRTDMRGFGEISDVCIKHKLRNRLLEMYHEGDDPTNDILLIDDDYTEDRAGCIEDKLNSKFDGELARVLFPGKKDPQTSLTDKVNALCTAYRDVRTFGYVLALNRKSADGEEGGKGSSVGVRGPVSLATAKSVQVIQPITVGITKSISNSDKDKKGSDTMGKKYRVDNAAYVIKGSISAHLAERTGFTAEDANALKDAIMSMFDGDESAARPAGTLSVQKLYWFEHNSKRGQYPVLRVHDAVAIAPSEEFPFFSSTLNRDLIPGLKVEELSING